MESNNIPRRYVLTLWVWVGLSLIPGTTHAVGEILSLSPLDKRVMALSQCNWSDFQADKISITENSITIWSVQIAFTDQAEFLVWSDCWKTLNRSDVFEILKVIWWDNQQQVFFFRAVLWMQHHEYWLTDVFSFGDRQEILEISETMWINFSSRGDWWGSRQDTLPVREKIL